MRENISHRIITVDRIITPPKTLIIPNRKLYTDPDAVRSMPRFEVGTVEVVLFKVDDYYISDGDLEKRYEQQNLVPASPFSLIIVNNNDLTLADEQPNITCWKDDSGKWYYCSFRRWNSNDESVPRERSAYICRRDRDFWGGCRWFAGVDPRKFSSQK
jgi:hypothetical protein